MGLRVPNSNQGAQGFKILYWLSPFGGHGGHGHGGQLSGAQLCGAQLSGAQLSASEKWTAGPNCPGPSCLGPNLPRIVMSAPDGSDKHIELLSNSKNVT